MAFWDYFRKKPKQLAGGDSARLAKEDYKVISPPSDTGYKYKPPTGGDSVRLEKVSSGGGSSSGVVRQPTPTPQVVTPSDKPIVIPDTRAASQAEVQRKRLAEERLKEIQRRAASYSQSGQGRVEREEFTDPVSGRRFETETVRSFKGQGDDFIFTRKDLTSGKTEVFEKKGRDYGGVRYTEEKPVYTNGKPQEPLYFTPVPEPKPENINTGYYGQGTIGMTLADIKNYEKIKEQNLKAQALLGVPAQYLGNIFNKQLNEELSKRAAEGDFIQRSITFLNPKFQYDVSKYNEQLKNDIKEANKLKNQLDVALKNVNPDNEQSINKYNARVDNYNNNPIIKRLNEQKQNTLQAIANSKLKSTEKTALAATVRVVQTVPYFFPATRFILGGELLREGAQGFKSASTTKDKVVYGGQAALGGFLAFSGARGVMGASKPLINVKGGGETAKAFYKGSLYNLGLFASGGAGALDYYSTLKDTKSKDVALGAALGTGGTIFSATFSSDLKKLAKPIKSKRGSVQVTKTAESEYIYDYATGRYIKKKNLAAELSRQIRKSSPEKVKSFVERQANIINKMDISQSEKIRKLQDLKNLVIASRSSNYKVVDGKVIPLDGYTFDGYKPLANIKTDQRLFKDSIFAGTGQYEKTTFVSPRLKQQQNNILNVQSIEKSKINQKQKQDNLLNIKSIQAFKQESRQETKQRSKQSMQSLLKQNFKQKQESRQETKQRSEQSIQNLFKQNFKQEILQKLKQRQKEGQRPKPEKGRLRVPPPTIKDSFFTRFKRLAKEEPELFEVFGRRRGKDRLISRSTSQLGAEKSLLKFLKRGLGRSGEIKADGRSLSFEELPLFQTREFRPSKKSSKRIVQKAQYSLGTSGEISEILGSRRRSKGKKKKRNLFFDF